MLSWYDHNKYSKWYFSIIENAKVRDSIGYVERHHIIPKSLGGSNNIDNIVRLYPKEHFICHWLLTKITNGPDYHKMLYALSNMCRTSKNQKRITSSWQYDLCKRANSESKKLRIGYKSKKKGRTYGKQLNPSKSIPAKWWNDGKNEIKSHICPEGWIPGRISKKWWNNKSTQILAVLPPDSTWTLGRIDIIGKPQTEEHKSKKLNSLRRFYSARSINNL